MRKRNLLFALLAILLLLILCSCELMYEEPSVGKLHILVYGNDYGGNSNVYSQIYDQEGNKYATCRGLECTLNDAVEVGNVLIRLAEKANMGHDITYLLGSLTSSNSDAIEPDEVVNDVTVSAFEDALEDLASADANDMTIIYYSGHGGGISSKVSYGSDTAEDACLVLKRDSESGYETYPTNDFLDLVKKIPGTKILIGDYCHSGSLVQSGYVSVTSNEYSGMNASELFSHRDQICEDSSLFCLSASRYYESSYEYSSKGHGYFTLALLEALGWDEDSQCITSPQAEVNGKLTLFNIAKYVTENDGYYKQTPMLSGGSNDVVLFSF